MNLFLHWLRWDLRRFRRLLLAWTALLAGFSTLLWYQNANLRTIELNLLAHNLDLCALIFIIWLILLIRVLGSDPAAGVRPFWKTRPPSGYAVAGAKLVLAGGFFLFLPMLCWWLVLKTSGAPLDFKQFGPGQSWMGFLWWIGCAAVAALSFAAAAAASAGSIVARLIAAAAATVAIIAALAAWRVMTGDFPEGMSGYSKSAIWLNTVERAFLYLRAPWLGLLTAAALFIMTRRRRTPGPAARMAHLILPALAMTIVSNGYGGRMPLPAELPAPHPNPEQFASVTILPPKVRDPVSFVNRMQHSLPDHPENRFAELSLSLGLQGFPADYMARASWSEFTLVPDGGSPVHAKKPVTFWFSAHHGQEGLLSVSGAAFHRDDLRALSMTACRARGVLRIVMAKRKEVSTPVRAGGHLELKNGNLVITGTAGGQLRGEPLLRCTMIGSTINDFGSNPNFALKRDRDDQTLPLYFQSHTSYTTYFLYSGRSDWEVLPGIRAPRLPAARYIHDAVAGRADDWRLTASWYEDEGFIERPVNIDLLVIPRMDGDERKAEDILAQLRLPQDASPEAVQRQVAFALGLLDASGQEVKPFDMSDPLLQALSRYLAGIPREHLPSLLAVAERNLPPGNMMAVRSFDKPFCLHVASLLEAADVAVLRQSKPQLIRYFRHELAARNLIPYKEAHGPDWEDFTDEELKQHWEASTRTESLNAAALKHAARRGLPWVPATLTEIANFMPGDSADIEIRMFMSTISDCPAMPDKADAWLRENAAKLTWDAPTKRRVVPAP